MRIKGATGKTNIGGPLITITLHQGGTPAHHADRQTTAERLAIGDQIGTHTEILLCAARCQSKADKHLIENQHDVALGADRPELAQPRGVTRAVEMCTPRTVEQRRIAGRAGIRMQGLQRIDQYAGDIATAAQHTQRGGIHFFERVGFMRRLRITHPRLHIAPPAVIGTAETHQMRASRVIARQPHRLHHRLGARHVKRHLIEAGDLTQALHIRGHHRVKAAEQRPQCAHPRSPFVYAFFIKIDAEYINAIGTGQIIKTVAVEITQHHAAGRLHKSPAAQMLTHVAAKLERHAVGGGELHVRHATGGGGSQGRRLRIAFTVEQRETREGGTTPRHHVIRRTVTTKELCIVVVVERHLCGNPARHARMSGQRRVLGQRQLKARFDLRQQRGNRQCAESVQHHGFFHQLPPNLV